VIITNGQGYDFAPQALAERIPVAASTGYFYAEQGIELLNRFALYGEMYRAQPWVAAVVDKVAASGSRLTFNVWDKTGPKKTLDTTSAFAKLWQAPCPLMPKMGFWRWTFSTYEIYGEAFWLKIRQTTTTVPAETGDVTVGAGPVVGFYPMHPSRTAVKRLTPEEQKRLGLSTNVIYVFTLGVASAGILRVPATDVVPFLRYNPDHMMRGLSRIEPLRTTLYNEDASRRAIESWWKRGARPSLMISAPAALSDKAYDRLAAKVGSVHGGADQMGGTLVLEEGAKPVPVQLSAEEMQYIQSRVLNREEVCGVYDMPPPAVHILDRATFSNITEQSRMLYRDTMAPRLEDVEDVIDFHVRPDFGAADQFEGMFALDEVLRGDFETRAKSVSELVQVGVMKPAEGRPLFDLDDAGPVADRLYANSAIQELGAPAEAIRITAGTAAQPVPATPAEEQDVTEAEQSAARSDRQADEQTQPEQRSLHRVRTRNDRRAAERRGKWRQEDA
jgi:HK97 family phage portal protein